MVDEDLKNEFYFEIIVSIWGLPGVILETHFGILESPERLKNHIQAPKSILERKFCEKWVASTERRIALASQSDSLWPQVLPRRPQGRPKGAQKEPQETPKWRENRLKTWLYIKKVKISKMTTLPHENHIFKGSKGPKIDPKASQISFFSVIKNISFSQCLK